MNKLLIISIFFLMSISACDVAFVEQKTVEENVDSTFNDNQSSKRPMDYFVQANGFAKNVLGDKLRRNDFNNLSEAPRHVEIFSTDGLKKIVAFSNKDYPKSIKPTQYEHFTLFCLEYSNSKEAKLSFQNLRKMTEKDFLNDSLDEIIIQKIKFINGQSSQVG